MLSLRIHAAHQHTNTHEEDQQMRCRHLSYYRCGQNGWTVASCGAKGSPYVPSLFDLEGFCQGGRYALCPFYLLAGLGPQGFSENRPRVAVAGS